MDSILHEIDTKLQANGYQSVYQVMLAD